MEAKITAAELEHISDQDWYVAEKVVTIKGAEHSFHDVQLSSSEAGRLRSTLADAVRNDGASAKARWLADGIVEISVSGDGIEVCCSLDGKSADSVPKPGERTLGN